MPPLKVKGWTLWSTPPRVLVFVLAIEAVAVLATVAGFAAPTRADVLLGAGLAVAGIAVTELSMRVELLRRQLAGSAYINMGSIWILPAALLLPTPLLALVVAGLQWHLYQRTWRHYDNRPAYKAVFNGSVALLSAVIAAEVAGLRWPTGALSVTGGVDALYLAATIVTYAVVNTTLIGAVIGLSTGRWHPSVTIGTVPDNALEVATLGLGAIVAVLVPTQAFALIALLPTLPVLHRAVLVRQLEHAATTDGKTGVLNAATWHQVAGRELDRTRQVRGAAGVVMIDIDHFKRVNDTHGHLVGDAALKAVADALRGEMREQDLLCRFGGEEFVALLPGVSSSEVIPLAERLRKRVADVVVTSGEATVGGLTISVGAAVFPDTAPDLDGLLLAADNALFAAKNAGRDQVRLTDTAPLGD